MYCRATRTPGTATTLMVDWNQSIKKQQSKQMVNKSTRIYFVWAYVPETVNILLLSRPPQISIAPINNTVTLAKNEWSNITRLHQPMAEIITNKKQNKKHTHKKQRPH